MKHQAFDSVRSFESCIADYAGSEYAVAVDSCTNALFLCCKWLRVTSVMIPARNAFSVPAAILHSGATVEFCTKDWKGEYDLWPHPIIDSALRFKRGMYQPETYRCLSFNSIKHLKIGKGGMILTDNPHAYEWFKLARYLGRHENPCHREGCNCDSSTIEMVGWNMIMMPDQASRGLMLMNHMPDDNEDLVFEFQDLSKYEIYKREKYEMVDRAPA
jgi:dTDP-4-amino-4,6-dideoxygalactose transaminase